MSHINPVENLPNQKLNESDPQHKKLRESCRDFEAVMVSLVLKEGLKGAKEMSSTPDEEEESGSSAFKDFAYEQMSYCIGKTGMLGLGDNLYESMKGKLAQTVDKSSETKDAPKESNTLGRLLE